MFHVLLSQRRYIDPKNITAKHTVAMKHIEQYTDAATVCLGQNTKQIEIVECSDGDFSGEKLLIVVNDKDLKLNDSEPTKIQRLETEDRPVQVHVASDPQVISSTGPKVHSTLNGVAAYEAQTSNTTRTQRHR
jgi:hypothetical protein